MRACVHACVCVGGGVVCVCVLGAGVVSQIPRRSSCHRQRKKRPAGKQNTKQNLENTTFE